MKKIIAILISSIALALFALPVNAASVVTKETLKEWMDNGHVAVLDARTGRDWSSSEFKIKGADRTAPKDFSDWKSKYAKDQKLVVYCA
jgi:rhodanese-related sulfurtransferase